MSTFEHLAFRQVFFIVTDALPRAALRQRR
jgi:hypothetical protein